MREKYSLCDELKISLSSLLKQIPFLFIVILIIFLVGGDHVSGLALGTGFTLGVAFFTYLQSIHVSKEKEIEGSTKMPYVVVSPTFNPAFNVMSGNQEKSIFNLGGVVNTGNLSNITGSTLLSQVMRSVANTVGQLSEEQPDEAYIKGLLNELQDAIKISDALNDAAKADALEQVKTLAEAVRNPNREEREGIARRAITFLMGTISLLAPAVKLVEIGKSILPKIGEWFSK